MLPEPTVVPRTPQHQPIAAATSSEPTGSHPIVWQAHFTTYITGQLVSWGNPEGQVTNSDLELAVSVIHHARISNCLDIRERTKLYHTDKMLSLWWQRKGLETSTLLPSHILRIQAIHQQFHQYITRHDFVRGVDNGISNPPVSLTRPN